MAVEIVREEAGARLEILDGGVGDAPCSFKCAVPGKALALPDDRRAAALDRLRDVAPAVGRLARPGEKSRAWRGPPAVGGQAFDCDPLEQRENVVNQVFSLASSPSPGISIGDSGAS